MQGIIKSFPQGWHLPFYSVNPSAESKYFRVQLLPGKHWQSPYPFCRGCTYTVEVAQSCQRLRQSLLSLASLQQSSLITLATILYHNMKVLHRVIERMGPGQNLEIKTLRFTKRGRRPLELKWLVHCYINKRWHRLNLSPRVLAPSCISPDHISYTIWYGAQRPKLLVHLSLYI